jgi:polyhydroxybutyrate depolymerase
MRRRGLVALALAGALAASDGAAQGCGETGCSVGEGTYQAVLPETPPVGALVFLHGYGGTGAATAANADLAAAATERGYVLLAPDGLAIGGGRNGGRWNASGAAEWRDDVAFLQDVVADAADRFGFPPDRVLVAGFSGGGMMVWKVACDAPDAFAAYAPVAGLLWRPLPESCAGPVRLYHTHGWTDAVVPIEGRALGGGRVVQGDLFAGLALVRRAAGCDRDDPDRAAVEGELLTRAWTACSAGGGIVLELHPGGHVVPPGWAGRALDWFESSGSGG